MLCGVAGAAEPPLRIGTLVPDGTAWARELKAFGREVDEGAHLKVKFYWAGIVGDDAETIRRIRRGQLEGAAGAATCSELSPSTKVTRVQGLFPSRDEHERLIHQLPNVDEEFRKQGFVLLAMAGLGPSVVFSRAPVTSWDELKRLRLWRWDLDTVAWQHDKLMGLDVVPTSVESAAAFDAGKVDGFVALAASALAFQWHSRAPYVLPLEFDYLQACLMVSLTAWDALSSRPSAPCARPAPSFSSAWRLSAATPTRRCSRPSSATRCARRPCRRPRARRSSRLRAKRPGAPRSDGHVPADAIQWVKSHLAAHPAAH